MTLSGEKAPAPGAGQEKKGEVKTPALKAFGRDLTEIARKGGFEGAVAGFMQAASWGTPEKILRGLEERRKILGDFELNVAFRFGGTPYEVSERGLRLFAKEVLPVLKAQSAAKVPDAAE